MNKQVIVTICAISFFFSLSLVKADQERTPRSSIATFSSSIADGDATNIEIVNLRQLDNAGNNPEFSPDGSRILFEKYPNSIWVMNRDGRNKFQLIDNARRGAWSPDGTKIAYFSTDPQLNGLSIYDIKSKKKYHLLRREDGTSIVWSRDATKLFVWAGYTTRYSTRRIITVDLDNLKTTFFDTYESNQWIEKNGTVITHPKTLFRVISAGIQGLGVWGINKDDSFRRLILPGSWWGYTNLSPDLSEIVLAGRGIWLGSLRIIENPPNRVFLVDVGRNHLARLLDYCGGRYGYTSYFAEVFGARRNPLNDKIVGTDERLKGMVKFIKIYENHSEVRVIEEAVPITSNDVLTRFSAGKVTGGNCSGGSELYVLWTPLRKLGS